MTDSNPFSRAAVIDKINSIIGSTLTTTWTDAKINDLIDPTLAEISEAVPYIMVDTYQIESRRGTATSTSANNLVDATNTQFVSAAADRGKVVYNTKDKTWAVITSFSSTSQVGLSRDIFTVGEGYEIYNEGCWNSKQLNIEDSGDFLWVLGAVYPVEPDIMVMGATNQMKNVNLLHQNKIAELDTWYVDNSKDTDANKDVHLYLARQHQLNVMTDLLGQIDLVAGYAAGDTTIHIDTLAATETIYKDTLLYFTQLAGNTANSRLVYRVTEDVTLAANEGDVKIFPGLECAVSDNDDITFIGSTLTPDLQRILIDLVTGQILMAEGISKVNVFSQGGASVPNTFYNMGRDLVRQARLDLKALVDVDLRADKILAR